MIYGFEHFRLDADRLELWRGDEQISVEPQVFSLLLFLIENRNRVVSKDDVIEAVWNGRIISEATLSARINAARRAIDDSGADQAYIRTIARRGFRFVADVSEVATDSDEPAVNDLKTDLPASGHLALPDKPSIVVLPFGNLSTDRDQEYFSDGITEDITTALLQIRWLFVIARNSAFSYKGQAQDVRQIAAELGVRYVLEGSVRRANDRVRIAAQLIDGTSGIQVWAERFERELDDIFALQDTLTEAIIAQIEPELAKAEQRRSRQKHPHDLGAWDIYQRGMFHLYRRTKRELEEALCLFEQALAHDSSLVPALVGSVDAYYYQVVLSHAEKPEDCREKALVSARRAVELDPEDATTRNSMGKAHIVRREHGEAVPELELALEMNPSLAWAHYGLGAATVFSGGDGSKAVAHIGRAIRLSPRDAHMGSFLVRMADAQLALGDYEAAVEWARRALRQPGFQWSRYTALIAALGHLGRVDEARSYVEELTARRPDFCLSFLPQHHLYTPGPTFDHYIDGLQKAGVSP